MERYSQIREVLEHITNFRSVLRSNRDASVEKLATGEIAQLVPNLKATCDLLVKYAHKVAAPDKAEIRAALDSMFADLNEAGIDRRQFDYVLGQFLPPTIPQRIVEEDVTNASENKRNNEALAAAEAADPARAALVRAGLISKLAAEKEAEAVRQKFLEGLAVKAAGGDSRAAADLMRFTAKKIPLRKLYD